MRSSYVRQLDTYPTGGRRVWLLAMAVIASLLGNYEAQIAPIVPILLKDLHMSLVTYGNISAIGLVAGAVAGLLGGRLTDSVGRVKLLVPLMFCTAVLSFLAALVQTPTQFLVARTVLAFVDGLALASTAPLVRDFSPRMGRATAFGFWTWGPVGANFIAAAIAGATLPLFGGAWQSQFIIMGCISLVLSIVVALNIAEISPTLRATILQTEQRAVGRATEERPARMSDLLRHREIWAHCLGIAFWLVLYITLVVYGQTMLVSTFGVSTAQASRIMMVFWVLNLATLIVAGRISDRLQLRRPLSLGGTIASLAVIGVLIYLMSDPAGTSATALMITGFFLGGFLGTAFGPWMANYSENAEDIDPRLQGSAWGLFSFITKVISVLVVLIAPHVVGALNWRAWVIVSLVCMTLFGVAILFFRGPWRRSQVAAAELTLHPAEDAAVVAAPAGDGVQVPQPAAAMDGARTPAAAPAERTPRMGGLRRRAQEPVGAATALPPESDR
jgi:OPA family glycerol-3-phosphate transporter-like MFS transporter